MIHSQRPSLLLFIVLLVSFSTQAQNGNIDEASLKLAKEAHEQYADEIVLARKSQDAFEFAYNRKNKGVKVTESSEEQLICIDAQASISQYKFYDEQSRIKKVEVWDRSNRLDRFPDVKDEYHSTSSYFYSDARVQYFPLHFDQMGDQYRVRFEKEYSDVKYLTRVYFHKGYPVAEREVRFTVPSWLEVELKPMNFEGFDIQSSKSVDKKGNTIHTFIARDLPGFDNEEDAPGNSHIYPHLLILAKSFLRKKETNDLFRNTQDLYNWYHSLVDQMNDAPAVLQEKVSSLTTNASTDEEKIRAIYYWVQDNIRYIAFEDGIAGFKPEECQQVYSDKFGDCKGMANLTKQMLTIAGFDARLTWIGTRHIAYDYSIPSLAVDNHMICTVMLNGKTYFLDPTEKYSAFGDYAERLQGKEAMIENGATFLLEKVPLRKPEDNIETITSKLELQDNVLRGKVTHVYEGESRAYLLQQINYLETTELEEALNDFVNDGDKNQQVFDLTYSDFENRDQALTIQFEMAQHNAATSFGNEVYLELDRFREFKYSRLKDRKQDLLFDYKQHTVREVIVQLPEGMRVKHLPEDLEVQHERFSMQIRYTQKGNQLIYRKEIQIPDAVLKKADMESWNAAIEQLRNAYRQLVILEQAPQNP